MSYIKITDMISSESIDTVTLFIALCERNRMRRNEKYTIMQYVWAKSLCSQL